jgi:hypothetical protein
MNADRMHVRIGAAIAVPAILAMRLHEGNGTIARNIEIN